MLFKIFPKTDFWTLIRETEPTVVNTIAAALCLGIAMVIATVDFFFFPDPPYQPGE